MLEKRPAKRLVAACFLSFLFIAQPGCILLEEPPAKPDFYAREARAADAGFTDVDDVGDVGGADADVELAPGTCKNAGDCVARPISHHMTAVCASGICKYKCSGTFENCDGNLEINGCEADLANSLDNCGTCGTECKLKDPYYQPICVPSDEDTSAAYKCNVMLGTCASGYTKNEDTEACECEHKIDGVCKTGEDG